MFSPKMPSNPLMCRVKRALGRVLAKVLKKKTAKGNNKMKKEAAVVMPTMADEKEQPIQQDGPIPMMEEGSLANLSFSSAHPFSPSFTSTPIWCPFHDGTITTPPTNNLLFRSLSAESLISVFIERLF